MPVLDYDTIRDTLRRILRQRGFREPDADLIATLCTDNSCAGVASHGVHWFPGLVKRTERGAVDREAEPVCEASLGALERWDGRHAPGPVTACRATDRAVELAGASGVGAVAVRNTNHWARPGWYGARAAGRGFGFICWTNTIPNMPAHGGSRPTLGNNPIVMALPGDPAPVVTDIAMSQFSYGRLNEHAKRGEPLPVPGGCDAAGRATTDAAAILRSGRLLPAGYWKGTALSFVLDVLAASLSGGACVAELAGPGEKGVSQVFVAFAMDSAHREHVLAAAAGLVKSDGKGRYPGEGSHATWNERRKTGIPVDDDVWEEILKL